MSGFPGLPPAGAEPRQVAAVVNRLGQGKLNCTGTLTLAPGAASTTVTDARAGPESVILLMPLSTAAAAALGGGALHVSDRGRGTFTLAHDASAATDRTFGYAIIG
ncbi:MAG: hypothetical protein IRY94_14185 [Rhodospirillaceae bacterium]|nr:hypothetical protein [Rhodospirillaceae bacterium]